MENPLSLLPLSPEEGARRLALSYLAQAEAALPRLADADDAEGLHDFRVAVRRLRSCLRSYRASFGGVPKKLARRLKKLAATTGPGRDAEVQLDWIAGQSRTLGSSHRPGSAWLIARLTERKEAAYGDLASRLGGSFSDLAADLTRRLSVFEVTLLPPGEPARTFATETARLLRREAGGFAHHLGRIDDPAEVDPAHEARIAGKRLRYLLDPLAAEVAAVKRLVKHLKALQDLLGELHDAHVLESTLATALEEAARERARQILERLSLSDGHDDELRRARRRPLEPGILALARANRERRDRLFAALAEDWLGDRAEGFFAETEEAAAELAP